MKLRSQGGNAIWKCHIIKLFICVRHSDRVKRKKKSRHLDPLWATISWSLWIQSHRLTCPGDGKWQKILSLQWPSFGPRASSKAFSVYINYLLVSLIPLVIVIGIVSETYDVYNHFTCIMSFNPHNNPRTNADVFSPILEMKQLMPGELK